MGNGFGFVQLKSSFYGSSQEKDLCFWAPRICKRLGCFFYNGKVSTHTLFFSFSFGVWATRWAYLILILGKINAFSTIPIPCVIFILIWGKIISLSSTSSLTRSSVSWFGSSQFHKCSFYHNTQKYALKPSTRNPRVCGFLLINIYALNVKNCILKLIKKLDIKVKIVGRIYRSHNKNELEIPYEDLN